MDQDSVSEILELLRRFQAGYRARNLKQVDAFMDLFVDDTELEVIGTNAWIPGEGEWCLGREAARHLVVGDWKGWGDLELDLEAARIHVRGEAAWLAVPAKVIDRDKAEDSYKSFMGFARYVLEHDDEWSPQQALFDITRFGTELLVEIQAGAPSVWPLRFTAVAVREEDGRWRFHQMTFSFPTTRIPDERARQA